MNGVFSPIAVGAAVAFCTLATTGQTFAEDTSPYGSVQTAHFQSIERSPAVDFQSEDSARKGDDGASDHVFPYLNYVTLTHDEAFRDDFGVIVLRYAPTNEIGLPAESIAAGTTFMDENPSKHAVGDTKVSGRSEGSTGFVAKPMSSIRLAGIDQPVSRDGEPLRIPTTTSRNLDRTRSTEEHFTPEPWHHGHPNRNTFAFRHQPLYFEDPNLERCGQSAGCLTEAVNIVHFAGRIPLMGYLAGSNPPSSCVRALPDCPTCQSFGPEAYVPPPTVRAIASQAVHSVGFAFLIP